MAEFEVKYYFSEFGMGINIYQARGPGYTWHVAKPVILEFTELKENEHHEPTLKLNHIEGGHLLDAFSKCLANHGDSIEKLKGKLEVMERYVEDLRKLLKLGEVNKRLLRPEEEK